MFVGGSRCRRAAAVRHSRWRGLMARFEKQRCWFGGSTSKSTRRSGQEKLWRGLKANEAIQLVAE